MNTISLSGVNNVIRVTGNYQQQKIFNKYFLGKVMIFVLATMLPSTTNADTLSVKSDYIASASKINNEIFKCISSDSLVVLIPDSKCVHVNIKSKQQNVNTKSCENSTRFMGIPIRSHYSFKSPALDSQTVSSITKSIRSDRRLLAGCYELQGLIVAYSDGTAKVFKFDYCNGLVEFNDNHTAFYAYTEVNIFDKFLEFFKINDSGYNKFKNELGISNGN